MLLLLLLLLLLSSRISRRSGLRLSVLVVRVVLPVGLLLLVGVLVLLLRREDVLHRHFVRVRRRMQSSFVAP